MTRIWKNWLFLNKSRLVPFSIFILGLTVFSGVALHNLSFKNTKVEEDESREEITIVGNVEGAQVETGQPDIAPATEGQKGPTASPTKPVTKESAPPAPTATAKPAEVKEVHTKEVIEEKTVVVVTAVPTPTPTIAPPTPTPTPDTRPFEASMSNSGETYTVTANKPLQSCEFVEASSGGVIVVRGSGEVNGNVCTVVRGNPSFPRFGMKVASIYGEEKTFGDW